MFNKCFTFLIFLFLAQTFVCDENSFWEDSIEESHWHMIIGGAGDPNTTELFNWLTGEQCFLGNLPAAVSAHSGTLFEGSPFYCGGADFRPDCYKYNLETKSWEMGPRLNHTTFWAGHALVPGEGWILFGGIGSYETVAQQLTSLSDEWSEGPELFESYTDFGQCVLQLNDSTTVFLGGSLNKRGIVTLDWDSGTYKKQNSNFTNERHFSSCAVLREGSGKQLVVIVGGSFGSGHGMEVWDPSEDTVQMIQDEIPGEEGSSTGLSDAQILTTNGGTEFVLYGGSIETYERQDTIWKYSFIENSWTRIGSMLRPRSEHVVIPVFGLTCDRS